MPAGTTTLLSADSGEGAAGFLPGRSQAAHIWEPELFPLFFPLRWTALARAFCVSKAGTGFQNMLIFFPLGVFSKVSAGNGRRCLNLNR